MKFKEKSNKNYVLFRGWIAFYRVDFKIIGDGATSDESIIHDFINSPQDFEVARKYVGGYFCNHTDEVGVTNNHKIYNFGPYPINQLQLTDYIKVSISDFEKMAVDMLSDVGEEKKNDKELPELIHKVKKTFKTLNAKNTSFFQLLPPKEKIDELSGFTIDWYLCGFSVNRKNKVLTIIQIDDD